MSTYIYQAKKEPGQGIEGVIEAATRYEAIAKINQLNLFLVSLKEEKTSGQKGPVKVSLRTLVDFTQQLSTLVNSGSILLASLEMLASQTEQVKFQLVLRDIIFQIKKGETFSASLERYPVIFSRLYISLVQIGEASGSLGENLDRLSIFLEEEADFNANIISTLIYPFLIILVGLATVIVLLRFVIPKLTVIFEEMGQSLPAATSFLVGLSDFLAKYWFLLIGIMLIFGFSFKKYLSKAGNRLKWDQASLKLPLLGELLNKIEVCRLARTLSILLRNSVPINSSLKILANTVTNSFIENQILKLEQEVKEGFSLSKAMGKQKIFKPTFTNLIAVGENSGKLSEVLENISKTYNREINRQIKSLLSLLEPILILGIGLIVGFVVISMLLPIFQIDFNF